MTLVATVTKKSVTSIMDKLWSVTMDLTLTDGGVEVLDKDYALRYRPGDSIAEKQAEFVMVMQADIDAYKSGQVIFKAAALDTVTSKIQAALEV